MVTKKERDQRERTVLLQAQDHFRGLQQWPRIERVKAFGPLHKAAQTLGECLASMSALDRQRLSLQLRQSVADGAEGKYDDDWFDELVEASHLLAGAASHFVAHGRPRNDPAHSWVWIAADHWSRAGGNIPRSKPENSRFWRALSAFQDSSDCWRELPTVGLGLVKSALEESQQRRVLEEEG